MQSLAEFLGTKEGASKEAASDRQSALQGYDFETCSAKEFAEHVLNSREFRNFVLNGLILGELPAAIVTRLMDYAWGKPIERLEVKDTTQLDGLSVEQLESRALQLAQLARQIRAGIEGEQESTNDSEPSIH